MSEQKWIGEDGPQEMWVFLDASTNVTGYSETGPELARANERAVHFTRTPQWQPIESAPKDGSEVDLWHPKLGRITGSNWDTYMERWTILCDAEGPTHFMLPPAPPEASA